MAELNSAGRVAVSEIARLAVVVGLTAGGFAIGDEIADLLSREDIEAVRLVASVLGALVGYVLGGLFGRLALRRVDQAQEGIRSVDAAVLVSGVLGATVAALFGIVVMSPLMVLPGRTITLPIAAAVVLFVVYAGARVGSTRAADLGRFIGVRGRLEVTTPSRGQSVKVVDSSVLIDARVVDVARAGFLAGTLVVPQYVLEEMQGLADSADEHTRALGRRGLDAVVSLQEDGIVTVEVTQDNPVDIATVDGKLAALCRERSAALVTNDSNLAQVAEVSGIRVLNINALVVAVRPPAVPGDQLPLRVVKEGSEPGQGVGYLEDGTMVVVEKASERVGETIDVNITSIVTNRRGRMLFAHPTD